MNRFFNKKKKKKQIINNVRNIQKNVIVIAVIKISNWQDFKTLAWRLFLGMGRAASISSNFIYHISPPPPRENVYFSFLDHFHQVFCLDNNEEM